jgi:hypothetical protein
MEIESLKEPNVVFKVLKPKPCLFSMEAAIKDP